jgi:methionine sulfoxide reductase heme-binding subunit
MALTRNGYLFLGIIAFLLIVSAAVIAINPSLSPFTNGIRFAGLAGFVLLAAATITTPWSREIYRNLGTSFVTFHHSFAVSGLILITLHPVFLAVRLMTASVFLPWFGSFQEGLVLAGRPSLILIYVGVAGVLLRRFIPVYWRFFHALIWVALILGIMHADLIGTDLKNPVVFLLFNGLAVVVAGAFVLKRLKGRPTI